MTAATAIATVAAAATATAKDRTALASAHRTVAADKKTRRIGWRPATDFTYGDSHASELACFTIANAAVAIATCVIRFTENGFVMTLQTMGEVPAKIQATRNGVNFIEITDWASANFILAYWGKTLDDVQTFVGAAADEGETILVSLVGFLTGDLYAVRRDAATTDDATLAATAAYDHAAETVARFNAATN